MGINEEAAEKAIETKKKLYGENVFSEWGKLGKGKKKKSGFAYMKEHDPERFKEMINKRGRKNGEGI